MRPKARAGYRPPAQAPTGERFHDVGIRFASGSAALALAAASLFPLSQGRSRGPFAVSASDTAGLRLLAPTVVIEELNRRTVTGGDGNLI